MHRRLPRLTYRRVRLLAVLLAALLALAAVTTAVAGPGDPDDPAPPNPAVDPSSPGFIDPRLYQPQMPANPTLADRGAQTWWGVCMACHGDAGQGLTDEWRQTAFGEDMNCWSAKCHGPRHPEYGFTFPRIVPPAWGAGTLKRFVTADELQAYLLASMPWWNPGSLTVQQSWEVTAFLLTKNGVLPPGATLDPRDAHYTPVHLPVRSLDAEQSWSMVWLGVLALAAVGLIVGREAVPTRLGRENIPTYKRRASFFHHLHPATIPAAQARWRYTLGAGGMAVFLCLILLVTGILEMYFYIPTPEQAAESVQTITFLVPYGKLVRGLHFWAAQGLVVVAVVHLLRVILTGAFVKPRRFNYLLGLGLLVLVLFLDFTGYVLRWDEGIRWALVVGANLLKTIPAVGADLYQFVVGGNAPGAATLTRFYAWHIFGLTLIVAVLVSWHIFRVRRDGGIAAPERLQADESAAAKAQSRPAPAEEAAVHVGGLRAFVAAVSNRLRPSPADPPARITRFELVRREVLAMLIAGVILTLAAIFLPAPLAPTITDAPTAQLADARAPWFFLWVQHLLRYGDAFWMGVAIPLAVLALLAALPYLFPRLPEAQRGRWFPPAARRTQVIAAAIVIGWLVLTLLEVWR